MQYTILVSKGSFADIQTAANAEDRINWWDDGQVADQTTCTIAWAATEIAQYLKGNVSLVEMQEGWANRTGTVILMGTVNDPAIAQFAKEFGIELAYDMPAETLRIVGIERDGVQYVLLTGADRVGVMYGAFAYLERLGVHFIEPGEPAYGEACAEPVFDITESPSYITRGTKSSFIKGDEMFCLWMAHNRFNDTTDIAGGNDNYRKKLGINRTVGGHMVFSDFLDSRKEYPYCHEIYGGEGKPRDPYPVSSECTPPSGKNGEFTYGDAHPEWYALFDGERRKDVKRDPDRGWHPVYNLCTSNENAMNELCRLIVNALAEGDWKYADILHINPLDGGKWCQCEACREQGNYSTRLQMVTYWIGKAIKEAYRQGRIRRKILLDCCAYHETLPVPDKPLPEDFDYENTTVVFFVIERCYAHNIDEPICTEANQILLNRLSAWCDKDNYKGTVMIGEYYNVSSFAGLPFVLTSRILNDIPVYHRMGARHFYYMHITARDWGFIAINNYIHGKLLWNVDADGEALLNTYFTARYGKLAGQMRDLYEQMEKVTANCKYYKHYQYMNGKIVSLKNTLNNVDDVMTLTEETLFPTKHMQFRGRADDPQAGPSMEETMLGLGQALEQLLAMEKDVEPDKMLDYTRNVRRLKLGYNATRFIYLVCLCIFKQATAQDEQEMHNLAKQMSADTESMMGYETDSKWVSTALEATWLADVYYKYFAEEKSDVALGGMLI
ncbi:MAG: DUF4838 domain-containing protein [Oscillospiraceae bacterium]|nr:DUF4838 domain-containing protein [Oscillospiraceae bacterium]